jgi:transposase-like protein
MLWAGRLDKNMATRKRHSPEQVVRKLATADRMLGEGKDVADVCRELAISEQTYYRWRNQFGGLKADDAKRLKDLERENATLKRLLADVELERPRSRRSPGELLRPERRRAAVAHLIGVMGVSERFACRVTGQNRTTQPRPPTPTTPPRSGRRAGGLATSVGQGSSAAQVPQRLPRRPRRGLARQPQEDPAAVAREGLRVPHKRRRKRLGTSTTPNPPKADAPNRVWVADVQVDATTDARPVKIVSIVDEHTRECLGGLVERSITGEDLLDELDRIAAGRSYPAVLRCDIHPEWCADRACGVRPAV